MKDGTVYHDRVKSLEDKIQQLEKINTALMDRVERGTDNAGSSYSLFESNLTLQNMVRERTRHLHQAQTRLAQNEKMAALGKLVAGIAHEVNTPVGVIASSADTIDRALSCIENALKDSGDNNNLLADKKNRPFSFRFEAEQQEQFCGELKNRQHYHLFEKLRPAGSERTAAGRPP
jgi:phosphoglycerate-specific signal transduction histidine kinase